MGERKTRFLNSRPRSLSGCSSLGTLNDAEGSMGERKEPGRGTVRGQNSPAPGAETVSSAPLAVVRER